jgi:hypothetical protein
MSEEVESANDGTLSGLKKTVIGVITTAVMGLGTWVTTKLTGGEDDKAPVQQAAPVINIQNNQTQSQAAGGKTVIIKEKSGEPAKPAAPVKKKDGDEFKEKPAAW